jgi:hypothetical protein
MTDLAAEPERGGRPILQVVPRDRQSFRTTAGARIEILAVEMSAKKGAPALSMKAVLL